MTPAQQAVDRLQALSPEHPDTEHIEAEKILCEFLRAIGHAEVADAFEAACDRVGFWYA